MGCVGSSAQLSNHGIILPFYIVVNGPACSGTSTSAYPEWYVIIPTISLETDPDSGHVTKEIEIVFGYASII
jgi:hypothetical protein